MEFAVRPPGRRNPTIPDEATHGGVGTVGGGVGGGGKSTRGSNGRHTAAIGTVHLMAGPRDSGHIVHYVFIGGRC